MNVLYDSNLKPWNKYDVNGCTIYIAGSIFYKGKLYSKNNAAILLHLNISTIPQTEFIKFITILEGQFSFIYNGNTAIYCFVDKIRSFPLFYSNISGVFNVSNNAINLINSKSKIDKNGLLEFRMAGYTLESKTIYDNIIQLSAGEGLILDKIKANKKFFNHFKYIPTYDYENNEKALIEELDLVINKSIQKLIEVASGRKIILPLSGGLDSRIILAKLLQLGYDNLISYTYGPKYLWEIKIAENISKKTNIKWFYFEFNKSTKNKFSSRLRKDYYLNYSGLSSIPHLADFYAIDELFKSEKINSSNSIFTNGQSGDFISGGHIPRLINNFDYDTLIQYLINKHFSLWLNLLNDESRKYLKTIIASKISFNKGVSAKEISRVLEHFECHERQFKYVVNGQRAYDFYGFDWYLPLWSDEMLSFWEMVSLNYKIEQRLYKNYCLKINPRNLFDDVKSRSKISYSKKVLPFYYTVKLFDKIARKNYIDLFKRKYFNYYGKYAPFYPQNNINEFLRDSVYHRHCVSYWVKYFLSELDIK